jgi:CheY-like chemotaxis protein
LTIVVEDTGVGIRPEHRERIFETFTQVEPISRGASAGAGLGLPIARWIAERLGGSLHVESDGGQGSRFVLQAATGPLEDTEWIESPGEAPASPARALPLVLPRSLRGSVLLAEDAQDIRDLIAFALRGAGAEIVTVADGAAAVQSAQLSSFDLILLDLRMPVVDGIEAAGRIRRNGYRGPLIALTASTGQAERTRVLHAGFDDLWPKPISLEALLERSAAYLGTVVADVHEKRARAVVRTDRFQAAVCAFIETLPGRVLAIRNAVEGGDLSAARTLLHQLVGAGGIHGFFTISELAARLLQHLRNGTANHGAEELRALEDSVAALRGGGTPSTTEHPHPA